MNKTILISLDIYKNSVTLSLMKLFGLDTEKEYTDAELEAAIAHAHERFEFIGSQIIVSTIILCVGMAVCTFVYTTLKHFL